LLCRPATRCLPFRIFLACSPTLQDREAPEH
jgi:hypothetical protein